MAEIVECDAACFKAEVLEADSPVLVDFHAAWCGPCRTQAPILEHLAGKLGGAARVVKVDVDRSPELAELFAGRVVVLSGPANASGATMVIAKLRDMGRVTIMGEASGGSADGPTAGTIFNVKLPNSGISVRVPLVFNQMAVDRFNAEGGISPDVPVAVTVADFRAGRDRVLERAIAEVEG